MCHHYLKTRMSSNPDDRRRKCCDTKHDHNIWEEFEYRIDVYQVANGGYIEHL